MALSEKNFLSKIRTCKTLCVLYIARRPGLGYPVLSDYATERFDLIRHYAIFTALVLFIFPVIFSCGVEELGTHPAIDIQEQIEIGKQKLAVGDGQGAFEAFEIVQAVQPDHAEAAFGLVLSDMLLTVALVEGVVDLIQTSFPTEGDGQQTVTSALHEGDEGIGDTIHKYLDGIFTPVITRMNDNLALCKDRKDFVFETDKVTILFGEGELYVFYGAWDYDDMFWMDSLLRSLRGLTYIVFSVDLNFDLRHILTIDADIEQNGVAGVLEALIEAIYLIFHDSDYPDFLTNSDSATELMPQAGIDLGLALQQLVVMQLSVEQKWANPELGILSFEDTNSNGVKESAERFTFNGVPLSEELSALLLYLNPVISDISVSILDGSPYDADPYNANYWDISGLNPLIQHLTGIGLNLVPEYQVDLGGYFTSPDFSVPKEFIADFLYCTYNEQGLFDALWCMWNRLGV